MVGPDVGGFLESPNEELMARWSAASVVFPFARNHNAEGFPDQHPSKFKFLREHMARFIQQRYMLTLHFYSRFISASTSKGTVVEPMFFHFPNDGTSYVFDHQIMIGSQLLAAPVVKEGVNQHELYLPETSLWFDFFTGVSVPNGVLSLTAPWERVFFCFGREPEKSLDEGKVNLFVGLNEEGGAEGVLLMDDGKSIGATPATISCHVRDQSITLSSKVGDDLGQKFTLNLLRISAVGSVTKVVVNGIDWFKWEIDNHVLLIDLENRFDLLSDLSVKYL
ncbi:hypothetical protein GEMRC1_011377 [Eukaryota sp. GEM-RC1]